MDMNFDKDEDRIEQPDLETTLTTLRDGDGTVNKTIYYGLSGLEGADIAQLSLTWDALDPVFRRKVLQELLEAAEANVELNYTALGSYALGDSDPGVREAAIELLWEDESIPLMDKMIDMALYDDAFEVRAAAASALGRFILLGELGDLPGEITIRAQDAAVSILNNLSEDIDVRRRALEAIANCGHEIVDEAIREAYDHPDRRMNASAVFAMGRTYDEQWNEFVLQQLDSDDAEMRYEAARAAGELEIEEGVRALTRLALDDDREIKEVAIWSLGEIGTKEATRFLERLATDAKRQKDAELLEAIEDAIGTASMSGGNLYLMKMDDEDDD
jgi:HEAT repeat protein